LHKIFISFNSHILVYLGVLHTTAVGSRGPWTRRGTSPLKYTNCRLCTSLERKVYPLKKSLDFHKYCEQVFLHRTNFWHQNSQKVLPCRHFGGLYLLPSSVKAERTNFCSPPIKLLEFLHSTDSRSVKCPLPLHKKLV
jgi:hypothetical protein